MSRTDCAWISIDIKVDDDGRPVNASNWEQVSTLLEKGLLRSSVTTLGKMSETIVVGFHSTPPGDASDTSSEAGDDEGWQDLEPDEEQVAFRSLLDEKPFGEFMQMLQYDATKWNFHLAATIKTLGLDFYESIKLVNYVRTEARRGNTDMAHLTSKEAFAADEYLKPVLDDDAVLFNLEPAGEDEFSAIDKAALMWKDGDPREAAQGPTQISNLEEDRPTVNGESSLPTTADYQSRISQLEQNLQAYERAREESRKAFLNERSVGLDEWSARQKDPDQREDHDRFYFNSYSTRDIHEQMLKDTARTDAYRNFIYENKHLFAGKTVLDVGCGTGILSMMCAKAGARHVYAIDNSAIIDQAREIIFVNGLQDVITCVHGKVEEITLPVNSVDIIVSEWMGYALLYEAMLDSVLVARDKWLVPEGLMAPSEISLYIAPLADPELITDKSEFWADVYGFDMKAMGKGVFDGALIEIASPAVIPSDLTSKDGSAEILRLDLHTATIDQLTFQRAFRLQLNREIVALDGFVLWFDAHFTHRSREHSKSTLPTGPLAKPTHWQQVKLVRDPSDETGSTALLAGQTVHGTVEYSRPNNEHRNLEVGITWNTEGSPDDHGSKKWKIDY